MNYAKVSDMKTYFHSFDRPEFGLAYWGITLIPPESLGQFQDILLRYKSQRDSSEMNGLIILISEAIERKNHIILFGI